jgi:hypothetical protein
MYECRRIMTNVVTFEIVRKGLTDPLMRNVATQIAGECTSTYIFKDKLIQIAEVNQVMPEHPKRSLKAMPTKKGNQMIKEKKKERKTRENNEHANAGDKPIAQPNAREGNTKMPCSGCNDTLGHTHSHLSCSWCRKRGYTAEQCCSKANGYTRPHHRLQHTLKGRKGNNANRDDDRQGAPSANTCSCGHCTVNKCNENRASRRKQDAKKNFVNGGW